TASSNLPGFGGRPEATEPLWQFTAWTGLDKAGFIGHLYETGASSACRTLEPNPACRSGCDPGLDPTVRAAAARSPASSGGPEATARPDLHQLVATALHRSPHRQASSAPTSLRSKEGRPAWSSAQATTSAAC